jgi:hypothetical protein
MADIIKCLLTGDVGPAIDAHIIPEKFYSFDQLSTGQRAPLAIVKAGPVPFVSRSWNGVSDKKIVTAKGEEYFSACDSYAHEVLVQKKLRPGLRYSGDLEHLCVEIGQFDYAKLKLFFISLLWRAAVSKEPFFDKVALSSFEEEKLRTHILSRNPGSAHDYSVLLSMYRDTPKAGFPMLSPRKARFGLTTYEFHLGHLVAFVKVSPDKWEFDDDFVLKDGQPLRIIVTDNFSQSRSAKQLLSDWAEVHAFNTQRQEVNRLKRQAQNGGK